MLIKLCGLRTPADVAAANAAAPDFAADWALAQDLAAQGVTELPQAPSQAVPEPGALGLAGLAAVAALGMRRRRAK